MKVRNREKRTATQRVAESTAALIAAGGARKNFSLSPAAHQSLQRLMSLQTKKCATQVIENLLIEAANKLQGVEK